DHVEKYLGSLKAADREAPEVAQALDDIAGDQAARERFLEFARDADLPAVRARMLHLARDMGWLTATELRAEYVRMIRERLAGSITSADIDLACSLEERFALSADPSRPQLAARTGDAAHSAVLACLGSVPDRASVLRALTGGNDEEVRIAQ